MNGENKNAFEWQGPGLESMNQIKDSLEECRSRYSVEAICPIPEESGRSVVGITMLRNGDLTDDSLKGVIEYAQEMRKLCPASCKLNCHLENIARSTPQQLRKAFFPQRIGIPSSVD